eukprot:m.161513 g.161513  ORF g.161513 m.161513 type:complete len:56 (+) comp38819_c1_seq27:374-541(+)
MLLCMFSELKTKIYDKHSAPFQKGSCLQEDMTSHFVHEAALLHAALSVAGVRIIS